MLAPVSVRTPAEFLIREPVAPETEPPNVPADTVSAVVPRTIVPPLSVATEDVVPLRFAAPEVSVSIVATPPTVSVPPLKIVTPAAPVTEVVPPVTEAEEREPAETVPPERSVVSKPTTVTVPAETPPVIVAALPKRVEPAPVSEARVIVPVSPEKFRLLAVVLAFVTAPESVRPVPEIVAVPKDVMSRVAAAL